MVVFKSENSRHNYHYNDSSRDVDWSSCSQALSPIKHVWCVMKSK